MGVTTRVRWAGRAMTNEFHDAIQPGPPPPTHTVDHPHFYQAAHDQQRLNQQARNMTRQQLFDNGFLTAEDLDDEELRAGRCRDPHGRLPKVTKTMEMVPRDLYDEMVAEHAKRFDERLRQQLDTALDTMADIMADDANEPKDRMEAAKWFVERVRGKSVERVAINVSKAPWEELLGDVAHITRAQHLALKEGAIDAEVVEDEVLTDLSAVHGTNAASEADQEGRLGPGESQAWEEPVIPTPFEPVPAAPSFDNLATSSPTAPQTLSEHLAQAANEQIRVAEARANRKKTIDEAKRRRKARRFVAADVLSKNIDAERFAEAQERLGDSGADTGEST